MGIKLEEKHNKKLDVYLKKIIKQFQVYNIKNRLENINLNPIIKKHGFYTKDSKKLAIVNKNIKLCLWRCYSIDIKDRKRVKNKDINDKRSWTFLVSIYCFRFSS